MIAQQAHRVRRRRGLARPRFHQPALAAERRIAARRGQVLRCHSEIVGFHPRQGQIVGRIIVDRRQLPFERFQPGDGGCPVLLLVCGYAQRRVTQRAFLGMPGDVRNDRVAPRRAGRFAIGAHQSSERPRDGSRTQAATPEAQDKCCRAGPDRHWLRFGSVPGADNLPCWGNPRKIGSERPAAHPRWAGGALRKGRAGYGPPAPLRRDTGASPPPARARNAAPADGFSVPRAEVPPTPPAAWLGLAADPPLLQYSPTAVRESARERAGHSTRPKPLAPVVPGPPPAPSPSSRATQSPVRRPPPEKSKPGYRAGAPAVPLAARTTRPESPPRSGDPAFPPLPPAPARRPGGPRCGRCSPYH